MVSRCNASVMVIESVGSTVVIRLSGFRGQIAVLLSEQGIPYLAPEIQLLFKSKNNRTKDDGDATEVIPALDGRPATPASSPTSR